MCFGKNIWKCVIYLKIKQLHVFVIMIRSRGEILNPERCQLCDNPCGKRYRLAYFSNQFTMFRISERFIDAIIKLLHR